MLGKLGGKRSVVTPLLTKFGIKVGDGVGLRLRVGVGDKYGKKKVVLDQRTFQTGT